MFSSTTTNTGSTRRTRADCLRQLFASPPSAMPPDRAEHFVGFHSALFLTTSENICHAMPFLSIGLVMRCYILISLYNYRYQGNYRPYAYNRQTYFSNQNEFPSNLYPKIRRGGDIYHLLIKSTFTITLCLVFHERVR